MIVTDRYIISAYEVNELREAYGDKNQIPNEDTVVLQAAIGLSEERTRIYAMPAEWSAVFRDDGTILVTRKRNKNTKISKLEI